MVMKREVSMQIALCIAYCVIAVGVFAADDDTDMLQSLLDKGGKISLPCVGPHATPH